MNFEQWRKLFIMNMMQCNMFGSQKLPHGTCIVVPFANHIELQIGCAGSPWHRVAWRMEMMLLRKMQSQWGVWLEKKLRVCGMQLWTRINEQDKVIPAQSFYLFHLCNPVSWCVLMCPTHDSEALRLRTESLECLNLKIESERRDVGMLRIPGFSLKSV